MEASLVLLAYLAGSLPVGLWTCRIQGVDIRAIGSGNVGATNVARALGPRWAAAVLALDLLKGWAPVALTRAVLPADDRQAMWIALCMGAAVVGHVYPLWAGFRGGKGVATGLGVTLAVRPLAGGVGVAVYALAFALWRVSAIGSLAGTAGALLVMLVRDTPWAIRAATFGIALLIALRHRENLRQLRGA